jgi:hypothetical protein
MVAQPAIQQRVKVAVTDPLPNEKRMQPKTNNKRRRCFHSFIQNAFLPYLRQCASSFAYRVPRSPEQRA